MSCAGKASARVGARPESHSEHSCSFLLQPSLSPARCSHLLFSVVLSKAKLKFQVISVNFTVYPRVHNTSCKSKYKSLNFGQKHRHHTSVLPSTDVPVVSFSGAET